MFLFRLKKQNDDPEFPAQMQLSHHVNLLEQMGYMRNKICCSYLIIGNDKVRQPRCGFCNSEILTCLVCQGVLHRQVYFQSGDNSSLKNEEPKETLETVQESLDTSKLWFMGLVLMLLCFGK